MSEPLTHSTPGHTTVGAPDDSTNSENASLWQQVIDNDQEAFRTVVQRYQSRVSAVAYSYTGNFSWAQEVTQETFWQAWRGKKELRNPQRLGAWLAGIARNLSLQLLKRERQHVNSDLTLQWNSDADDPALMNVSREENETVWNALRDLPENYREPLVLFYREEHSIRDVAEVLALSEDTVKQRLSRGRSLLRDRLANQIEEVLVRSRPNRQLTTRIMAGVAALATSMKVTSTVSAATVSTAASSTAGIVGKQLVGSVATKTLLASPLAGGLLGVAGGLGGAWLGIWLPAELAETQAQRELLLRRGKTAFAAGVVFSIVLLLSSALLWLPISQIWLAVIIVFASIFFTIFIIEHTVKTQALLTDLRQDDQSSKNDSKWKHRFDAVQNHTGRSYTSRWRFLGLPLLDIQLAGQPKAAAKSKQDPAPRGKAKGWLAIGDQATGLIAFGGVATGGLACGGVAVGIIAFGGMAVGGLAVGGGAVGVIAVGGGAIGYDAAGGGAAGIHSAVGGGAVAYHVAVGGGAFAVGHTVTGGDSLQAENPDWIVAQQESLVFLMPYLSSPWLTIFAVVVGCGAPMLMLAVAKGFPNSREPETVQQSSSGPTVSAGDEDSFRPLE